MTMMIIIVCPIQCYA